MITELVFFDLPEGTTKSEVLAMYRQTAEAWRQNTDLIEKYYFFDEERSVGGGIYVWPSRAEAEKWHGDSYKEKVRALYGSPPHIQILDGLIYIDPARGVLQEF